MKVDFPQEDIRTPTYQWTYLQAIKEIREYSDYYHGVEYPKDAREDYPWEDYYDL